MKKDKLTALIKQKYGKVAIFANKVDLSESMVCNILNGKRNLMWYHWSVWGELLGLEPKQYREYFAGTERDRLEYFVNTLKDKIEIYHADCDLAEEDPDCIQCCKNIFGSIERMIDTIYAEVKG